MTNALKARLLGAAVLVGVALLVLGALLGGPKERVAPAGNVIIVQPDLEKPPTLAQRRAVASAEAQPAPAQAQAQQSAPQATPGAPASKGVATPSQQRLASPPDAAAETKVPEPKRTQEKAASTHRESPKNPPPASPKTITPAKNDLYAQIAGTANAPSRPVASAPAASSSAKEVEDPSSGWRIRVASYGKRDNAERMAEQLRDSDFHTQLESAQVGGRTYTRLYVGPYPSESDARTAQSRLQAKINEAGQLVAPK